MWIFDRETLAFLEVNRAAIRHYGYDADEFRRMTIADIRPGEDKAALFDLMRHLQAPDPRPVGTWRHRRKDGSIIDVEIIISDIEHEGRAACLVQLNDVTQRKAAEAALRRSNERFLALTDLSADWYWEQDANLRYTDVSDGYFERTGYAPSQILGRTRDEVIDLSGSEALEDYSARIARREPFRDLLIRHRRNDGDERIFCVSGKPVFGADGSFAGYRGIGRDVTEQQRMRAALAASERRMQLAIQYGNIGIWERELSTGRIFWSSNVGPMLGLGPQTETTLENFLDAVHPDDREIVQTTLAERAAGRGLDRHLEHRIIGAGGEVRWVSHCGNAVLDSRGKPISTVGVILDITERKRTEAALRESEEMFRQLAENIPEMFWISDPGVDHVMYVSPAFERFWNKPRESLYADANAWREGVHPDDLPAVESAIVRQKQGLPAQVEFRLERPGLGLRWLWAESSPFVTSSGQPLVSGIVTDITERKLQEDARLLRAHEQRDILIVEVHHRIKNSLQGLVGLLRNYIARHPEFTDVLQGVIAQVQSVATAHGLQGLRVSCGVELVEIVQAIARMVEGVVGVDIRLYETSGVRSGIQLAEGENVAMALVLNELIMNAAKHCRGPEAHVHITMVRIEDGVRLEIRNPGSLPPGFDMGEPAGKTSGLGLVRALLPAHGASLQLGNSCGNVVATLFIHPPVLRKDHTVP